jgi:hypothetical protein
MLKTGDINYKNGPSTTADATKFRQDQEVYVCQLPCRCTYSSRYTQLRAAQQLVCTRLHVYSVYHSIVCGLFVHKLFIVK